MISLVIPIYKEDKIVETSLKKITKYLNNTIYKNVYEIIVVNNAVKENTTNNINCEISKGQKVKIISIVKKGIGAALKEGFKEAIGEYLMFYAIDLPFGLDIIKESVEKMEKNNYDLVLGSKGHKDSIVNINLGRRAISYLLNYLVRLIYKIDIKDTQGSFLINRDQYNKIRSFITSDSAWIQAQIVIYAYLTNGRVVELPVRYTDVRKNSKMIFSDGIKYICEMLGEIPKKNKYARFSKNIA